MWAVALGCRHQHVHRAAINNGLHGLKHTFLHHRHGLPPTTSWNVLITSGGVRDIPSTSFWTSKPLTASTGSPSREADARNSGSFIASSKACRNAATRSGGTSGGATTTRAICWLER